jgi:hypothetical protein
MTDSPGVTTSHEIHLAARPHGEPTPANFALVEVPIGEPGPGEVLVRNKFFSVDPYMRGRMNDAKSYVPPFEVGKVMLGAAVGEVVASRSDQLPVGTTVLHSLGWREYATGAATDFRAVDPAPGASAYLGVLGSTGFTAYVGLLDIAAMKEGDVVFVSAAAGAVGSIVGQIAKARGASRVIGSAGTDEKVAHLTDELHFDAAFNYKSAPVRQQLRNAAPDGIDVYFDNVGGDHLEAAIGSMNNYGRIAACGSISVYNAAEPPPGPRNLPLIVTKRLTMRGFIIIDHSDRHSEFVREMSGWLKDGSIKHQETVIDGIDNAVDAFLGMLNGANVGKALVRTA